MSEMTVDFRRPDMPDNYSDVSSSYNYYQHQQQQQPRDRRGSSYYADDDAGSLVRSLSQPSLARSASEFTENNWGLRVRSYEDGDDLSSPDRTPRSSFRDRGTDDGLERRPHEQRHHSRSEQRYSSAEYESSGTARRTFGGGRTTSAAEWFHDSDGRDDTYRM